MQDLVARLVKCVCRIGRDCRYGGSGFRLRSARLNWAKSNYQHYNHNRAKTLIPTSKQHQKRSRFHNSTTSPETVWTKAYLKMPYLPYTSTTCQTVWLLEWQFYSESDFLINELWNEFDCSLWICQIKDSLLGNYKFQLISYTYTSKF